MSAGARILQTRWLVRLPIPMMRAGLGFVFGGRLLLLEHIGRRSGQHRYVALETVERPAKDRVIVASGFGETAQWFRNLRADPQCWVSIGFMRREPAVPRRLSVDEARDVIERYQARSPRAYAELSAIIEEATELSIDEVPLIELRLG
ncbi:nitroreductase family deazaflavin-dependent oxidoreductase [Gordonia zhaorongruii]|uniref:nitroreductase family deazaflavin-dependent oxidoreductase n=1 Tax=Gordonia zhaorongruii TaxID=2597659 RepID=UPI001044C925|nr:nitroreductase family deazaflavin-dependent oxidoreductase [Gordonia zhaorongruii]